MDKILILEAYLEAAHNEAIDMDDIKYITNTQFRYKGNNYFVMNDSELGQYFSKYCLDYFDDIILPEIPEHLHRYIDEDYAIRVLEDEFSWENVIGNYDEVNVDNVTYIIWKS